VSVPNTGHIHKKVVFSLLKLQSDPRYKTTIILPTWNPYEHNLHRIINDFMNIYKECSFWLNIDSDNPPINNPLDLIEFDRDIIGLPTPVWHFTGKEEKGERPLYYNAYDYDTKGKAYREHQPREGLQKVDAVGTGCLLISKRVFIDSEMRKLPFARIWNPNGTIERGNDIAFCERAKAQGFEIYAHYDYPCMHFCELELNEMVRAFNNLHDIGRI
jgi:hypothetical protein